jgi:predicted lipoprotein with Yx(FWY)xxD motif
LRALGSIPGARRRVELGVNRFLALPIALLATAAIALGACGSEDDDAGATAASDATLSVANVGDAGEVVVDRDGAAVYTSEEEAGGEVLCVDACEAIWLPVTVDGGEEPSADGVDGELATVRRPGGGDQITLDGVPLYTFAEDPPGEVTGDGFADDFGSQHFTWRVVATGESEPETESEPSGGYGGY